MPPNCLLLLVCLGLGSSAAARAATTATAAPDTLVPSGITYVGYRLHLRDIQLLRQRKDRFLVRLTVVNTGARPINLGPGFPQHILQTDFDAGLLQSGLLPLAAPLRAALLESRLSLAVAERASELEFWVTAERTEKRDVELTDAPAPKRPEVPPGRDASEPATRLRDTTAEDRLYASVAPPPPEPATPKAAATTAATSVPPVAEPADLKSRPPDPAETGRKPCVDLATASLKVTQRQRGSVMLQIDLVNLGGLPLSSVTLGGGATLDIYLGGASSVPGASQRLARINLPSRIGPSLGEGLGTGETITLLERLDVSAATHNARIVVVQIDPGQVLAECDETNNKGSLLLKD